MNISRKEQLMQELCIRFFRKPRKCKKINDSGIGSSERIVCIFNDTFFYYPKIQQFNDLDIDKLQYVVPKAGVKLQEIISLKFPPRKDNRRDYFTIIVPKCRILKYTKTNKELIVDQEANGEQSWVFNFEYDIISLPQKEKRLERVIQQEKRLQMMKEMEEQELTLKKQEQKKRKLQQEYQSLLQLENLQGKNTQYDEKKKQEQDKEREIREADELYFHEAYRKISGEEDLTEYEYLQKQLQLLQTIGRFRKRAQETVKYFIDQRCYSEEDLVFGVPYEVNNLSLKVDSDKSINQQFISNKETAHAIFSIRKKIKPDQRVPLHALIKYKGLKVLARARTPLDNYDKKSFEDNILHGLCQDSWKVDFMLLQYLNLINEKQNLKPHNAEVQFQNVVINLGTSLKILQTENDPYRSIKKKMNNQFPNSNYKITYLFDINEVYPIDLDLQKNTNQANIRLRPQFVQNYVDFNKEEEIRLSAGALMYTIEGEQGDQEDFHLAKASQTLKYVQIQKFVQKLDKLEYLPLNSKQLCQTMKKNGINVRYIGLIYKMTNLPYLREMLEIEAISREIKKVYRGHQKQFLKILFRKNHHDLIEERYGKKTPFSRRTISQRQLKAHENNESIFNAIDFLNLVFGNTKQGEHFWDMIQQKVYQLYKIEIPSYMDLSHGYLLTTVCYHCGFEIKMESNKLLFANQEPFRNRDWINFTCRSKTFTFPDLKLYSKIKPKQQVSENEYITQLELQLCIKRALGDDEDEILVKLAQHIPNIQPPLNKYSAESLQYYTQSPSIEKFPIAFQICQFILPQSHPFFLQLYIIYSKLKHFDPITLKRAAKNNAIRNLGLTHSKTSAILSDFEEEECLQHLIQAEYGVQQHKKMELYRKIVELQQQIGKYYQCLEFVSKSINFFQIRKENIQEKEILSYVQILKIAIEITYTERKMKQILYYSEILWNLSQTYFEHKNCTDIMESILFYCFKVFLENSNKKYYFFKIILILQEKNIQQNEREKENGLKKLREYCRSSKNHINYLKQLISKLQFCYRELNYRPNFFTQFDAIVQQMQSEEFEEGLSELRIFYTVFGFRFFENALMQRTNLTLQKQK